MQANYLVDRVHYLAGKYSRRFKDLVVLIHDMLLALLSISLKDLIHVNRYRYHTMYVMYLLDQ